MLINRRNAHDLTSLDRLQFNLRRSIIVIHQLRERSHRIVVSPASFLRKETSLLIIDVVKARSGAVVWLPEQGTHDGDACENNGDGGLEAGEDGGEYTGVCHVHEV